MICSTTSPVTTSNTKELADTETPMDFILPSTVTEGGGATEQTQTHKHATKLFEIQQFKSEIRTRVPPEPERRREGATWAGDLKVPFSFAL